MRTTTTLLLGGVATALAVFALEGLGGPKTSGASGWSSAAAISPVLSPDPTRDSQLNDVAVNASGLAVAAWDQYSYAGNGSSSIGAAVQMPGAKWGPPFTISGTDGWALHPRVAAGAEGTLAVAWTHQTPAIAPPVIVSIRVAVRPAGSTEWTTSTLASAPSGGVQVTNSVNVGVDDSGNVTAAWMLYVSDVKRQNVIQAARLLGGDAWSAPETLSLADGLYPSLSVNGRGDAAVVWTDSPYANSGTTSAWYAFRPWNTDAWSAPHLVSEETPMPTSTGYVSGAQVGLDAAGLATVIYLGFGLEATRQTSPASWTSPATVLGAGAYSSFGGYELSVDRAGNALVAASIFDATINVDRSSVYVARGDAFGSWDAQPLRLTDPTAPVDAYSARTALSADGRLSLVGWVDHYHGVVQVARLTGTGTWSTSTVGRSTAFSSFQEVLSLSAGASDSARAVWKSAKGGTQELATSYGR
jgi:hypothetical protein